MTSLTADDDPPRCHHNNIVTAYPSKPLRESIALKDGTRGNDSLRSPPLIILREIPTRISPFAPTADVFDRHDDDDVDRQPHRTSSLLSPTRNENNSDPLLPQPATVNFVDSTLDNINKTMRSWSPYIAINHDCAIPYVTPRHLSSLPTSEPLSTDNEPFDTGSHLDDLEVKAAQLHRQLQSILAANDPSPDTRARPDRGRSLSPDQTTKSPTRTPIAPLATTTPHVADGPTPIATSGGAESHQNDAATLADESVDPYLLDAIHSLDNFLLKHLRPTDSTDAHAGYRPSPDRRSSMCRRDLLAQQTMVYSTINVLLGELSAKLSQTLAALFNPQKYPITTTMSLKFSPRMPRTPILTEFRFPATNTLPSHQSIPAKPPFPCFNNTLTSPWTKDHLRPP